MSEVLETPPALDRATSAVDLAYSRPARARELAESVSTGPEGDAESRAVAERALGLCSIVDGDLDAAGRHLRAAVATADAAGLTTRSAECGGSLAYVLLLQGDTGSALAELARAEPLLDGIPAVRLMMMRSLIFVELARLEDAEAGFGETLAALAATGWDALLEADIRVNRSNVYVQQRNWRLAESDLQTAEEL